MTTQKTKLETQTLRKYKYGGTCHSVAEREEAREARRSDPLRYGVLRLRQEEGKLKDSVKKVKAKKIDCYEMYMDHLVAEGAEQAAVKGTADDVVERLIN